MFRTSNPTMKEDVFEGQVLTSGEPMTLAGAIGKSAILLMLMVMTATIGWMFASMPLLIGSAIGGFVLAIVTCFKKDWSPVTAPLYALVEGLFVGAGSAVYSYMLAKTQYANAVPLAVMGTALTFGVMLALYAGRVIRVTETLKSVIIGATIAVFLTYGASLLMSFFWPRVWNLAIYQNGLIGIGFSVFVIALAAFNLLLDFDLIEGGVAARAPKYMEWYAGFGLLVTLVWLYFEILRLISKLARR